MARLGGRAQDEVDCRGRWRDTTQRISDRYTSISLPFIDAKVASVLCMGGPAKYITKDGSNVSDHWLASNFVPHIAEKLGVRAAILLGKALLWCLMDPIMMHSIPEHLRKRLRVRYMLIQCFDEDVNPIEQVQLNVYAAGGQLKIDPVLNLFAAGADGEATRATTSGGDTQTAILSQNHALQGRVEELFVTVRNNNEGMMQRISTLQRVVQRLANRPGQINHGFVRSVIREGDDDDNDEARNGQQLQQVYEATLSKHPKDLYMMWEEYEFGIEGRKAAKTFTIRERGKNRYTYHRRKIVWDKIEDMNRHGHSHLTAIDALYQKYGRDKATTNIINQMRVDNSGN